jgi:Eukaryotic aspartyl protease
MFILIPIVVKSKSTQGLGKHFLSNTSSLLVQLWNSDLFVPSDHCDATCYGHRLWVATASSTVVRPQVNGEYKNFDLGFADGTRVSGMQLVDNVTIAGFTVCSISFMNSDHF